MSLFGHKNKVKEETSEKKSAKGGKKEVKQSTILNDTHVAISMSLYFYLNERHDIESDIITIAKSHHNYSPWNSKVFGLNKLSK